MALLVTKEWELSYVTPLYQFRHTQLKSYSKHLSAFIVSEKQQGLAIEVGQELGFKVNFSVVLGLAETDKDAETVFIQVRVFPLNVVWSSYFILLWNPLTVVFIAICCSHHRFSPNKHLVQKMMLRRLCGVAG